MPVLIWAIDDDFPLFQTQLNVPWNLEFVA